MRNLNLICHKWHKYNDVDSIRIISPPCDTADEIIVSDNLKIFRINTLTQETNLLINVPDIIPLPNIHIINFAYFSIERILVCAMNTGEILRLDMDSLEVLDEPHEFGKNIKAMQVSPDNELLIFVTKDNTVILTDCRLDIINTVSLSDASFGDGEFMTVGWGKKETQFHGSEGKEAAKKKNVFNECGEVGGDDVLITWRGDGALFAVGFCIDSVYTFKVFDREAVLKFTSEKQPGIECNFVWRPSGNLIATTQLFPNKYVVAFFEKNGLKHGEFVLPFKKSDVSVKKLFWSSDSEILCVWCVESQSRASFVLVYTVNNYHWYLKQTLPFSTGCDISAMAWDESNITGNEKLLHVFLDNGIYSQYNWVWCVDRSSGKTETDDALVGVIDGNNILLTSFRKAVIPPPMAAYTFNFENNINHIIFGPRIAIENIHSSINTNSFIAVSDNKFYLYTPNIVSNNGFQLLGSAPLKQTLTMPCVMSNFLWFTSEIILCIASNGTVSDLLVLNITLKPEFEINIGKQIPLTHQIIGLAPQAYTENVILQTTVGKLLTFSPLKGVEDYYFSFPEQCYEFEVCSLSTDTATVLLFGLTHRHRFYINDKEVANNITSFFVHSDFLVLTTLQHQLLCCPLTKDIVNILHVGSNPGNKNVSLFDSSVSERKLERGSKLVTIVSCDPRTILQLPRGNVEAIQPRALSLKLIGNFLDKCHYSKAFDLMRKQRINLNLIYDHNPKNFLEHIGLFISEINNTSWLSLFISDLDNVDVTKTMYCSSYSRIQNEGSSIVERKVVTVCNLMRAELQKDNARNKNLLPILTTYVKTNSITDLEKALLLIKSVKFNTGPDPEISIISADEAMKYLLYLVNVNSLYDMALGLYDFDLVMYVASKSQKDPKEYIPFLNDLRVMEENYQQFYISNHLKRFEKALVSLIACGKEREDELLLYVKQHSLYKQALRNIDRNDPRYLLCAEEYGNFLMRRKNYSEAGIMYKRSNNFNKAIESFIEAVDWRASLYLAEENLLSDEVMMEIRRKLLMKLKDAKMYSEALDFLLYSGNTSPDELLSCSLEGGLYKKSLSICKKINRTDLIENKIVPAVMDQCESLLSMINQNRDQFLKYKSRLLVVRQNKLEIHEDDENLPDDCDLFSDTSSMALSNTTRTSGRTFRSSKNRRKHERKLVSLKEGSRFEDIALVRALYALVNSSFLLRTDVADIIFVLQWLEKDSQVHELQECLDLLLKEMTKSFSQIWTPELSNDKSSANIASSNFTHESIVELDTQSTLEPHIRIAPVIQDIKWKAEDL